MRYDKKYDDLPLRTLKTGAKVIIHEPKSGKTGIGGAWLEGVGETNAGALGIGAGCGADLIKSGHFEGVDVEPDFIYEYFKFSLPVIPGAKGEVFVVLDKESSLALRAHAKASWDQQIADIRAKKAEEAKALALAVPGIEELRHALDEHAHYHAEFAAAMEDEMRDGVNMPRRPASNIAELQAQYPRAALYLKAEDYSLASHYAKVAAGDKAMAILRNGGSIEDAQAVLDNWLPEEAMWN